MKRLIGVWMMVIGEVSLCLQNKIIHILPQRLFILVVLILLFGGAVVTALGLIDKANKTS